MKKSKSIIFKYRLEDWYEQVLELPKDATILSIQKQGKEANIWVIFDVENRNVMEKRTFVSVGTGFAFNAEEGFNLVYIGTCLFRKGLYVQHYFEKIKA